MAPEPSNHKRKRGRPPNASEQEEADASQDQDRRAAAAAAVAEEHDADVDEERWPRKRERPRKSTEPVAEETAAPRDPQLAKRRGRPSREGKTMATQVAVENEEVAPRAKRKRGHPSLSNKEAAGQATEGGGPSSRRGENTAADGQTQAHQDAEPQAGPREKRGKKRAEKNQQQQEEEEEEAPQPVPEAEAVESQAGPAEPSPGWKKKQRRRSSQNAAPEDGDAPPSPPKPYPHIAPQVRRVRQSTIEEKWSPLAESSLSAASAILHLAHRPILQRLSNTQQRRTHTSAALRLVTHRITRKVARGLPFPPASLTGRAPRRSGRGAAAAAAAAAGGGDDGRAAELDFESVLDAMQALERQLDPALHAVELLTREKEKLERELERDYETLRNLESSARAQAREHRGLLKKAHVLAPTPEAVVLQRREKQKRDVIFRHNGTPTAGEGLLDDLEDKELKPLALQLGDHVESIKNNLQQTDGIIPQLAHTRAALQDVLFRYVDQGQYEHVLLG